MAVTLPQIGIAILIICVPIVFLLFQHLYFVTLPARAIKKYGESDPERLRRYLERVVASPTLTGDAVKLFAHGALVGIYLPRGQHAEAAAHCRANLKCLEVLRQYTQYNALEADTRRRLADCLEALGQVQEAAQERRLAEQGLSEATDDTLRHLTQGTLLERQHRYEEAYAEHLKALELAPVSNVAVRVDCMVHLVLASYNAGRPVDCLRWAEEAIATGATGRHLRSAHRMAGVACGNLGQLEQSEDHTRKAYEAAEQENNKPAMAEILGSLADCLRKRGKLTEAYETSTKAAAMDPKGIRISLAIQSHILREWGRFDEAIAVLGRHLESGQLVIPDLERRIRAVCALDTSRIEAECGRADDAWTHIEEAREILANDAKLGLKCDGAAAWVLAARGLADESQQLAAEVQSRLVEFERDPSVCRGVMFDLGMAACRRGDDQAGIDCWTRYLSLSPDPIYNTTAHFYRGECFLNRRQMAEANSDYRAAVAMGFDNHTTKLAQRRLSGFSLF